MIIPTRWRDVPPNARVVDPAGQVFHVLPGSMPGLASVRSPQGKTFTIPAPPDAYVPREYDMELDGALAVLGTVFTLEFLGEGR